MYLPECFAMNAGISAMYFLKPPKSFTDKSSTRYAFIRYLANQHHQFAVRMEGVEYRFTELDRSALRFGAPQMFIQPRHDLDEVAGPRAVVELRGQNAVPAVTAGAGRTRQAENKSGAGDTGGGAALHRGSADLGMAQHVEGDGKSIHPLFEQRFDRFGRHVAAGKTGAAGGDDDIDACIRNPPLDDAADR